MKKLREIREEKGLSIQFVADKLGVSRVTLWNYENGKRRVSISVLISLSRILDVSISELALSLFYQEDKT